MQTAILALGAGAAADGWDGEMVLGGGSGMKHKAGDKTINYWLILILLPMAEDYYLIYAKTVVNPTLTISIGVPI